MPCELLRLMFGPLSSDGASKIRKGLTLSTKALSQWDYMRHSGCQFSDKALRLRPAEGGPSRGACLLRLASRYMPSGRTASPAVSAWPSAEPVCSASPLTCPCVASACVAASAAPVSDAPPDAPELHPARTAAAITNDMSTANVFFISSPPLLPFLKSRINEKTSPRGEVHSKNRPAPIPPISVFRTANASWPGIRIYTGSHVLRRAGLPADRSGAPRLPSRSPSG